MAGAAGQQKTHDRCQPWVLVEIQLNNDKRQRRRLLRRRPGRLVDYFPTSREKYRPKPVPVKPCFKEIAFPDSSRYGQKIRPKTDCKASKLAPKFWI